MRRHVVKLARDAEPLLVHTAARLFLTCALRLGRALLDLGDVRTPVARRVAEGRGDRDHRDDAERVGCPKRRDRMVGERDCELHGDRETGCDDERAPAAHRANRVERNQRRKEDE